MLALIFIFFINYLANSVCASPPLQWNLTNSGNNVQIFAQLINDIYQQSQPIDKVSFNLTFVKYASEFANFRVIGNNKETWPAFNVHPDANTEAGGFVEFQCYSNKLDKIIANEFNKNIFCPEKPIPKSVVDQIMQLIFSYAARILLCLNYPNYYSSNGIGEWQMETLLSAYKKLAPQNDNNDDGIFPFPIDRQTGEKGDHMWNKFMNQNISEQTSERKQFIENFNFVLKLSEFSLSYYEVYKVLEAILNESNAAVSAINNNNNNKHLPTNDESLQPAVHTFLKQYFIAKLDHKSMEQYNVNKVDCAFVRFGRELERRFVEHRSLIRYPGFSEYVKRMEAECGKAPWSTRTKKTLYWIRSPYQLDMELFDEPLWNYAKAIQIDSHECKAVLQFAVALSKIVVNFELNSDKKNEEYSMDGITKLNEFKLLLKIIRDIGDTENYEKLENFERNNLNAEKKHSLNELSTLLKQIIEEYSSCTSSPCPFRGHFSLSKNRDELPKFGQILFETFNKYSDNVKYDEKHQLLSFPSALSEHILGRLNYLVQRLKLTTITDIGNELDFVKTIQNIASKDNIKVIPRKRISQTANRSLFKFLFTLAIRLSSQIEQNDLAEKYLKTFLFVVNQSFGTTSSIEHGFFALKIRNINKMVEVNLPTWKLPYFIYLENRKELEQENALKNCKFMHSLSKYSLTIYEIIKMANILGEINDGQIWISPSDSEVFLKVLEYLTGQEKPTKKIKVPIQNKFCVLAYFVEDLLEKAEAKNKSSFKKAKKELTSNFVLKKQKLCDGKPKKEEIREQFKDNSMLQYAKVIEVEIAP